MKSNERTIHLYNRFGFGLNNQDLKRMTQSSFEEKLQSESVTEIHIDLSAYQDLDFKNLPKSERVKVSKELRNKVRELNCVWLRQMITSDNWIQEKMNLFWHHHFACIIDNPWFGIQFTNILRKNATGNLKTMTLEIAKSAAMIDFLHSKQNKKGQPNEDFARELCELFMLGRDNGYTEQDVQEMARCFTGWSHDIKGDFVLHTRQHDFDTKLIFGKEYAFSGEEVIDLIIEKRECAAYISRCMYAYFVHPIPNETHVQELADVLYTSEYDIKTGILHIANADWFYAEEMIQAKIKSPIEFFVGLARLFKIDAENDKSWLIVQRMFDQVLFHPPNVKGWRTDKEWIDSNSLPLRLRLPSVILTNATIDVSFKPDYDSDPNDGAKQNKFSKKLGFTYNWQLFFEENATADFKELFFNNKISPQLERFLAEKNFQSKYEEVIQLISLPDYQLV